MLHFQYSPHTNNVTVTRKCLVLVSDTGIDYGFQTLSEGRGYTIGCNNAIISNIAQNCEFVSVCYTNMFV